MAQSFNAPRARHGGQRLEWCHLAPVSHSLNRQRWEGRSDLVYHEQVEAACRQASEHSSLQKVDMVLNCQYMLSACRADRHNG